MKAKPANHLTIFIHPVVSRKSPNAPRPLYCQEPADTAEVLLRFLLVLCLMVSLLLCGLRICRASASLQAPSNLFTPPMAQITATAASWPVGHI